jgi:four helix bundle protein
MEVVDSLPRTRIARHVAGQLLRCGTAPAAHYAEAQAAESRRDFIHKLRLCLKELRETAYWLKFSKRVVLGEEVALDRALDEADQLVAILYTSVRTAERNAERQTDRG